MSATDGVYAVIASATAGTSQGVIEIRNGSLIGNDIAGAEYRGGAVRQPDGSVKMNITMETPPGVFHIWTGANTETFQSRQIDVHLPREAFDDGKPFEVPGYGMTIIVRRIPDGYAHLAGPTGRIGMIETLISAEQKWAAHRKG
ncbi:hypothetical protein [Mesorhizobium amorphae]|uniref:Uncharacterized protein n=1 Tax=Mesorhizobium amorphae CCNWGS0123 TaxID=1082933 RepID=G6Y2Y9_9HYPH|nr:hypothetical protein [Mesorhizobium amorphae]ANT54483.1 hypothetical protein A6B35_31070 [Mesorhizobium amorphae CCNWGS0123]EHH13905.1 hypothetical protein MEA186_01211 [Mesorhizobium amorphae CCNWGS0123]